MDQYNEIIGIISLTMGAAWASGINLYAALLVLGIGGATGNIMLPTDLHVLQDPLVIGAAGVMYFVEFIADKTPGVDSGWDGIHTFIRIPAGALLAASAVGDVTPAVHIAAGVLGGGMSAAAHATKAGSRLMINTSPEPFSNWAASITEDIVVLGGLWTALNHPVIFLGFLAVFIVFMVWFLPKIWRGVRLLFRKIGELLGIIDANAAEKKPLPVFSEQTDHYDLTRIEKLKQLLDQGAITPQEFEQQKERLLNTDLQQDSNSNPSNNLKNDSSDNLSDYPTSNNPSAMNPKLATDQ